MTLVSRIWGNPEQDAYSCDASALGVALLIFLGVVAVDRALIVAVAEDGAL
jgi:hypothetical protein